MLVQPSKVQPPTLREDTLSRSRLLDWLKVKVHHRVVLVTAEAGYGKTTLLADFSARTRLRTLWYRLDHEDRDWVTFLRHLVAAGAEHDASFAPATQSLLSELSVAPTGPRPETVAGAYLRDLRAFADEGAVVILDDVHLVDDVPEIRQILRGLITRSPERITVVLSSRRLPSVPLARLRAQGEVADLTTDDLRFSEAETEQLFREAYHRPLEPDVLADLAMRTDGWVASLALVETAIRDRSPAEVRAFVRQLTGAEGDVHDYLAEEILSELPVPLQAFLMRSALLQSVDLDLAAVAASVGSHEARQHLLAAEQMGLLHRRGRSGGRRFHPLVREFLARRLADEIGADEVAAIHVAIADAAVRDWRIAAHHLAAAGASVEVQRLIQDSMTTIAGTGEYALANEYLSSLAAVSDTATTEVIRSRTAYWRGHLDEALQAAEHAVELEPRSERALVNRASVYLLAGDMTSAARHAAELMVRAKDEAAREIAGALVTIGHGSLDGSVPEVVEHLERLAAKQERIGHLHFAGISHLDAAVARRTLGDPAGVLREARRAEALLAESSAGPELLAAQLEVAWGLAAMGDLAPSRDVQDACLALANKSMKSEAARECASIETWFGSDDRAAQLLATVDEPVGEAEAILNDVAIGELALRTGDLDRARVALGRADPAVASGEAASKSRRMAIRAHLAILEQEPEAEALVRAAMTQADRQQATLWMVYTRILLALIRPERRDLSVAIARLPMAANLLVELIMTHGAATGDTDHPALVTEASRHLERWRPVLRRQLGASTGSELAAGILAKAGDTSDVRPLRTWMRTRRRARNATDLALDLARRVAPAAYVADLGRITVRVGERSVEGTSVRRKVLSLLCLLLTKPRFSATRDQVVEALWPDLDPSTSVNSLHQTVYFLRRVFEPDYQEDLSPGYVHFSSEMLWLDDDLVQSASNECLSLIREIGRSGDAQAARSLSDLYVAQFALEFSYEEWASTFRNSLHASYLQVVEGEIASCISSAQYDIGVRLARQALAVDESVDSLEVSLIRLYRMSGAYAAAAEQYAHYAANARELLGVDPPGIDEI